MHYIYAVMMLAAGLILIFSLSKENKVFYVAGGYFLFLGGWWLADGLLPEADLFAGGWGIAFKVITALVLVVLVAVFVKEYRKKGGGIRGKGAAPGHQKGLSPWLEGECWKKRPSRRERGTRCGSHADHCL